MSETARTQAETICRIVSGERFAPSTARTLLTISSITTCMTSSLRQTRDDAGSLRNPLRQRVGAHEVQTLVRYLHGFDRDVALPRDELRSRILVRQAATESPDRDRLVRGILNGDQTVATSSHSLGESVEPVPE